MNEFVIYVRLEKYLHEWITSHLGNPVVFPSQSHANAVIRTFITKLPKGKEPILNDGTMTAIVIPDSKAKPRSYYNYMGEQGQKAVKEVIKDLFRRSLWTDISPLDDSPVGLNTRIAAWCEMHGIGLDRVETVRQCYYRMRDQFGDKGINLRNSAPKNSGQSGAIS